MSARALRFAMLAFLAVGVTPVAAWSQTKPDTAKSNRPATKSTTLPATKTVTPPATKTVAPPATKTVAPPANNKTVTPPTKQATPANQAANKTKTAPAPVTQQKTAAPATAQQKAVAPPRTTTPARQKTAAPPATQQQKKGAAPPVTPPKAGGAQPQKTVTPPAAGRGGAPVAQTPPKDTVIPSTMMREVYEYNRDGRRDPFISLLTTTDLRPNLLDLRLLMTVVDEPGRSVALVSNAFDRKNPQRTLRVGDRLGRMRVTSIRPDVVIFTIEEFGTNRRDSLLLRDSTKARVGR